MMQLTCCAVFPSHPYPWVALKSEPHPKWVTHVYRPLEAGINAIGDQKELDVLEQRAFGPM